MRVAADMAWWVEAHFSRCGTIAPAGGPGADADAGGEADILYATPYNSAQQLVAWVLSMGEAAELLEPPELATGAELRGAARRASPGAARAVGRRSSPAAAPPTLRAPRRGARARRAAARARRAARHRSAAAGIPTGRSKPTASPAWRRS